MPQNLCHYNMGKHSCFLQTFVIYSPVIVHSIDPAENVPRFVACYGTVVFTILYFTILWVFALCHNMPLTLGRFLLGQCYVQLQGFKLWMFVKSKCVCPFQALLPSLMYASKAWDYPSEAPLDVPHKGRLLALTTNIRLDWKSLPETNTLAFHK